MLHIFRSLIVICFKCMLHLVPFCYTEDNAFNLLTFHSGSDGHIYIEFKRVLDATYSSEET